MIFILAAVYSCAQPKKTANLLSNSGYRVSEFSQYSQNNWIPVNGQATFIFSDPTGQGLNSTGTLNITYINYSDIYGDCNGSISATLATSTTASLATDTSSSSGPYDIFTVYTGQTINQSTDNQTDPTIVSTAVYQATVNSMSLTNCPFPNYTNDFFIVTLYQSGTMIITDWNRSKDYLLQSL